MKFCMHNWMRPEPIETTLARLHRFGYDSIEISGEPERYDTDEVRRLLDRYELQCWGAVTIMTEGRDLAHPDYYGRLGTVAYMKDCIRMLRALDAHIFCIVPATVGKTKPTESVVQEWRWVVAGLKEVAEFARENGITPGIEPLNRFETYLINRHDEALELADAVGFGTGVVLDTFHINLEEADPLGAIRATGSRLIDMHVADNNRRPAGQGRYDWGEVLRTLREIGYAGPLTAEFVLPIDRTPRGVSAEKRESDMQLTASDVKFIEDHGSGLISAADYDRAVESNIVHLKQFI
jgi:D-psicose/D-tagatose/L-ribulose 3-epimerase